jgi:hypothetical protein
MAIGLRGGSMIIPAIRVFERLAIYPAIGFKIALLG